MEQEKRIIFQRGLLDWMLPFWTLLSVCEIRDIMQIIYKELTRDWVKPNVAKSEFYPLKSQNARELRGKFTISSIKFQVSGVG